MTTASAGMGGRTGRDWRGVAWVVAVTVASCIAGLGNDFAFDDLYLIKTNERVHDIWNWQEIVTSPFWPAPLSQDLYRPLTSLLHALEYGAGGGAPVVFRLVSYVLYALVAIGVLRLASRVLPRNVALGVAILFAAHPVHTEAVAMAAGQAELLVAGIAVTMVALYVDVRRRGTLHARHWVVLSALYVVSCLVKEQGFVLPGLLVAAELCLIPATMAERVRQLWKGYAGLAALAAAMLLVRRAVLNGDVVGTFTAEALQGLSAGGRALTMLAVVPQWARLLVWPAHLRIDYSLQEMVASTHFGASEAAGAALLLGVGIVAWMARRRAPVATFGVLWCAVSLLPVSNVFIPAGILLAERTLLLPSVGVLLLAGALVLGIARDALDRGSRAGYALQTACIVLTLAGVLRSAERQLVWRNEALLAVRSVQDAPASFRTQRAYGDVLFQLGERKLALEAYERSIVLAPRGSAWRVRNALAGHFRELDERPAELEQLRLSLAEEPAQSDVRGYVVVGNLALGRYAEAAEEADLAIRKGMNPEVFRGLRALADSAARASAPPGSVKIRIRTTAGASVR